MWRGFQGRIFPETILVFYCITGSDVREEDSFILRLMNRGRFREVKSNNVLKFTKEGLLDRILRLIIVGVAINKAFVL